MLLLAQMRHAAMSLRCPLLGLERSYQPALPLPFHNLSLCESQHTSRYGAPRKRVDISFIQLSRTLVENPMPSLDNLTYM
jgi:hypothetical protein